MREDDYEVTCCEAYHNVTAYSFCLTELKRPGIFNIKKAVQLGIPEGKLYKQLQLGTNIEINGNIVKSTDVVGPRRPGRKIGISGDTRPTEKLRKFFENCDLLIFESTYAEELRNKAMENFHGHVWASHHNCRALVDHNRQFNDDQIKELISRGAVIGGVLDAWMMVPNWIRHQSTPMGMNCNLEKVIDHMDHICQLADFSVRSSEVGLPHDFGRSSG